jgi:hypothetical protein
MNFWVGSGLKVFCTGLEVSNKMQGIREECKHHNSLFLDIRNMYIHSHEYKKKFIEKK